MDDPIVIWMLRWGLAGVIVAAVAVSEAWWQRRRGARLSLRSLRIAIAVSLALPLFAMLPAAFAVNISHGPVAAAQLPSTDALGIAAPVLESTVERAGIRPMAASANQSARSPARSTPGWDVGSIVGAIWLAAALGMAAMFVGRTLRLHRLFARGGEFAHADMTAECRLSGDVSGPVLFGLLNPKILLPADFAEWSGAEQRSALSHEKAHIERGDLWWFHAATLTGWLYWWSPPSRMLVTAHLLATEEACDADAAKHEGLNSADYVRSVIALTRRMRGGAQPGLTMFGSTGITRRIALMLDDTRQPGWLGPVTARMLGLAGSLAVAMAGPTVGHAQPVADHMAEAGQASICVCTDDPPFRKPWPVAELDTAQRNDERALLTLSESPDEAIRAAAVRALGDYPTAAARGALRRAARDPATGVQAEAIEAIARNPGRDRDIVLAALSNPDCQVAAAAMRAMGDMRESAARQRLEEGLVAGSCVERRAAAEGLAGYSGPETARILNRALGDPDSRVRTGAARSLGQVGDGTEVTELIGALHDESKHVRQAAADTLGHIAQRGDETVLIALAEAALDDSDHVRYEAVNAITRLGDQSAEPLFIALLDDPNDTVRAAAAEGLGAHGSARSREPLLRAARSDPNDVVRAAAIEALGDIPS